MASLFDAVERPRVIINTNDFDKPKSLADNIEREPEVIDGIPDHHKNILQSTVDKLFGLHGEERYQLWPERLVRDAVSAPHDVMTGQIPTHEVDPVTGEVHTSSGMIKAAQDVSALAGTGGLAGAGNEAGMALGSGPLKPKFDFSTGGVSSGSRSVKIGPTEITYGVNPKNNDVELSLIRTDKNERGKGAGRAAIEQFLNEADTSNKRVLLNADPMDKSTSKNKLVDFYKSLGFVRNKGRNKDFTTRSEFIRNPFLKSDSEAGLGVGALNATNKPFYSAVENAVTAAKQPKADAQQWLSFLKNQPGVKQEELAHLGLDKLSGSITKDDLLKVVQEGQPHIKEVIKGGKIEKTPELEKLAQEKYNLPFDELNLEAQNLLSNKGSTKYHSYQLPGGSNYREMLLTLPVQGGTNKRVRIYNSDGLSSVKVATPEELERLRSTGRIKFDELEDVNPQTSYTSSHWDEPNVLAHIRMNDRMIDGKKSLHLEEIQSDWHQEGRKKGYKSDKDRLEQEGLAAARKKLEAEEHLEKLTEGGLASAEELDAAMKAARAADAEFKAKSDAYYKVHDKGVPDAPFKKTWDELALKKAITHAVKNGYDSVSWTPGEAQAARYDLSKQVDRLQYWPEKNKLIATDKNGNKVIDKSDVTKDKLSDFVGKEAADKLLKTELETKFSPTGYHNLEGADLKVGGQGMKAFYDKMLVDKMNALTKKHGGKVEKGEIGSNSGDLRARPSRDGGGGYEIVNANDEVVHRTPTARVAKDYMNEVLKTNPVHVLKITPELREHVLKKGFPLFSAGVPVFSPIDYNPFKKDK